MQLMQQGQTTMHQRGFDGVSTKVSRFPEHLSLSLDIAVGLRDILVGFKMAY
jgi:hypothetical protein